MQGYCMKCRTKAEMNDTKAVIMKNGRPATKGLCSRCGTKIFRIYKSQEERKINDVVREDEVRLIAYHIWQKEGGYDGRDSEYWLRAEMIWKEEQKNEATSAYTNIV